MGPNECLTNTYSGYHGLTLVPLFQYKVPRIYFKIPRVLPFKEQKEKFEADDFFKKLARESEVSSNKPKSLGLIVVNNHLIVENVEGIII